MRLRRVLWKPHAPAWQVRWAYREAEAKGAVWISRDGWWWLA